MLQFKRFLKRFLISLLIAFTFWFVDTYIVKASSYTANYTGYVNGNYQYEYKSRVNSYFFNDINSYFGINNENFYTLTGLHLTFDFSGNVETLNFPSVVYDQTAYLVIDYCSTGLTIYDAYSTYNNYLDYIYTVKPDSCYASSQFRGNYNRIFLRKTSGFNMNFITGVYTLSDTSFGIRNDAFNYPLGRFLSATLYDASDYNLLLENVKKGIENQTIIDQNNATNNKLDDLNDSINDDDTSGASSDAETFFNDFTTDTHGLTSIITAPLTSIASLTSSTCSPLVLPLPFVNSSLTLPCMREIYDEHFGAFMTIYDIIVIGIISYWIIVRIFTLVKDFKNPEHDEVEVMEL